MLEAISDPLFRILLRIKLEPQEKLTRNNGIEQLKYYGGCCCHPQPCRYSSGWDVALWEWLGKVLPVFIRSLLTVERTGDIDVWIQVCATRFFEMEICTVEAPGSFSLKFSSRYKGQTVLSVWPDQ